MRLVMNRKFGNPIARGRIVLANGLTAEQAREMKRDAEQQARDNCITNRMVTFKIEKEEN